MCEECGIDHPMPEDLTFYQVLNITGDLYTEMTAGVKILVTKAVTPREHELIANLKRCLDEIANSVNAFVDDLEEKEKQLRDDLESVEE